MNTVTYLVFLCVKKVSVKSKVCSLFLMSFFLNNFRTTFSNLMYDSSKFKLEHPLYDKKRMNKKIIPLSSQYLDKPVYFFGAPGMFDRKNSRFCLFFKGKLYVAGAGDSRAVLYRDNIPVEMSRDHTPESERKRIQTVAHYNPDLMRGEYTPLQFHHHVYRNHQGRWSNQRYHTARWRSASDSTS